MALKIGINGLGRIGRMVIRAIIECKITNITKRKDRHRYGQRIGRTIFGQPFIYTAVLSQPPIFLHDLSPPPIFLLSLGLYHML